MGRETRHRYVLLMQAAVQVGLARDEHGPDSLEFRLARQKCETTKLSLIRHLKGLKV